MAYVNNYLGGENMPRRDGTGPMGAGSMTGRGIGICSGTKAAKYGAGLGMGLGLACRRGFGRGFGRSFAANQTGSKSQKELLQEQRSLLQAKLEAVDKQMESL